MQGINFHASTGMFAQVIRGRKTKTRRMGGLDYINKEPDRWRLVGDTSKNDLPYPADSGKRGVPWYHFELKNNNSSTWIVQPRYKVGETVFIKESHYIACDEGTNCNGCPDGCDKEDRKEKILYKADFPGSKYPDSWDDAYPEEVPKWARWSNAMFCGQQAARYYIRIRSVSVERLQDITREDAAAEGCCFDVDKPKWVQEHRFPEENFATLIDIINGKHTWDANPWCWVYQFELTIPENNPIQKEPTLAYPNHISKV